MVSDLLADLGTRAGLHGRTLISSGLADFDKLLGGGLPLGCLVLILEVRLGQPIPLPGNSNDRLPTSSLIHPAVACDNERFPEINEMQALLLFTGNKYFDSDYRTHAHSRTSTS